MSGTSLDGVDLAFCAIDGRHYQVIDAATLDYTPEWRQRLATVENASAREYALANAELGHLYGRMVKEFLAGRECDAVASHGHTVFHQPERGLTAQIGDGDAIAAECGLPVVSNFRTLDVALGGQGAPLVPIGDELFFGRYDACLNLGGIANISYRDGQRVAFDICPCNMALNRLAYELGLPFDRNGDNARRGLADYYLGQTLATLPYYRRPAPKSLGKEWFLDSFWPMVEASGLPAVDKLRTVTEHIATQIAVVLNEHRIGSVLVTGGGAHNGYLIELLKSMAEHTEVVVPDQLTVDYKEAIVFALLGYLRLKGEINTMCSVTGACVDSIGGTVSGRLDFGKKSKSAPVLHKE